MDGSGSFIDYLNKCQEKKSLNYMECIHFLDTVGQHYNENDLGNISYTGEKIQYGNTFITNKMGDYYDLYSDSIWNIKPPDKSESSYSLWQKTHDILSTIKPTLDEIKNAPTSPSPKLEKMTIDININKLKDVLKIIDQYEYKDHIEYNIDLKSLHNIKTELHQLDAMVGMESLKQSILDQLLYFIQDLHVGLNTSEYKHTVLYGSPGTGKTEIAKIIGVMYSKLGILKNNVFKKVSRNDLIAGYLGQTAIKTRAVIDECLGGVLFIDEAYSLASSDRNDSFSKECIDILCQAMSDHKEDLMVIIAGYEDELNETFFRANRGLESRFIWRFKMDAYTPMEMMQIFKKKVMEQEWSFEKEDTLNVKWFESKKDQFKHFGRDMEILLSYTKIVHGRRIYGKDRELRKVITLDDINRGYEMFLKHKDSKPQNTNVLHTIYI